MKDAFDKSLRSALTYMITSEINKPPSKSSKSINYLKNRIFGP